MNSKNAFFYGLMIATIIALVAAFFAGVFMYLWNWLVPELFNGPVLNFWQAIGLIVLAKMIFGFGSHNKRSWHKASGWKSNWKDRCANLSEEDKEKWKSHFMNKWNCDVKEETKSQRSVEPND